jgi:hypothetical protein
MNPWLWQLPPYGNGLTAKKDHSNKASWTIVGLTSHMIATFYRNWYHTPVMVTMTLVFVSGPLNYHDMAGGHLANAWRGSRAWYCNYAGMRWLQDENYKRCFHIEWHYHSRNAVRIHCSFHCNSQPISLSLTSMSLIWGFFKSFWSSDALSLRVGRELFGTYKEMKWIL